MWRLRLRPKERSASLESALRRQVDEHRYRLVVLMWGEAARGGVHVDCRLEASEALAQAGQAGRCAKAGERHVRGVCLQKPEQLIKGPLDGRARALTA